MNRVKIQKLSAVDNPEFPTPSKEHFVDGEAHHGVSIPVEYTITGVMRNDLEVGQSLMVARDTRNGVEAIGIFYTSVVTSIEPFNGGLFFSTQNSKYRLEWLQ